MCDRERERERGGRDKESSVILKNKDFRQKLTYNLSLLKITSATKTREREGETETDR